MMRMYGTNAPLMTPKRKCQKAFDTKDECKPGDDALWRMGVYHSYRYAVKLSESRVGKHDHARVYSIDPVLMLPPFIELQSLTHCFDIHMFAIMKKAIKKLTSGDGGRDSQSTSGTAQRPTVEVASQRSAPPSNFPATSLPPPNRYPVLTALTEGASAGGGPLFSLRGNDHEEFWNRVSPSNVVSITTYATRRVRLIVPGITEIEPF